jgi:GT2 family glycosyltransferase
VSRIISEISVVVPTIGRDVVGRCLESIRVGTTWPARLVVVDQGENNQLLQWIDDLRSAGIETLHLRAPLRGAAAARNHGFRHVATPFVAATDDDCLVASDWLEKLVARLKRHPTAIVTGQVESMPTEEGGAAPSIFRGTSEEVHVRPLLRRDPLSSGNMGFALSLLSRIGPMDEHPSLRMAEDAEWSYRALRAGVPIVYAPEVRVSHLEWRDPASMATTYRSYARSQGSFYGLYVRRGDWFAASRMAFDLLRGPWIIARGLLTRNEMLLDIGAAYLRQLMPGFIEGWRRPRAEIGPNAKGSDQNPPS